MAGTKPVNADQDLLGVSRIINLPAPTASHHAARKADVDAVTGGTGWFDLSVFTRSTVQAVDAVLVGDISDTTTNPAGTLKRLSLPGLAEVQRRLLTNFSASDQSPFSSETYLVGSNVIMPDTPVVGSSYQCDLRITKTGAGTATPIFNLKIGSNATTADTTRATLTFGAGTAVAETVWVHLLFFFTTVSASGVIEGVGDAAGHLSTTGFANGGSGGGRVPTVTSSTFDNTSLAGLNIGLSYNGGASAAHTVSIVRSRYVP